MTAMVRPVCINNTDFCDCGISVLCISEISLKESEVIKIHSKALFIKKLRESGIIHCDKAFNCCYLFGGGINSCKCFGLLKSCFTAFNCIYYVMLEGFNVSLGNSTVKCINLCCTDKRTLALRNNLNTLCGRVCSLVKLTGKSFNSENVCFGNFNAVGYVIKLRLRENSLYGIAEKLFRNVFSIVAVEKTYILKALDAEKIFCFTEKTLGFVIKPCLLFYKYTINPK